ncbi:RraA family protein [Saccharothrix sp. 6-C]|uniref:RraA family protein n=1 Tax=Saccharothrix sp. 6-C TaxID=2781735 RepID=UPI0019171903|nr:RraA family protein [Saccharothrix sp. 6-C]QQQ74086.1 RraA family protein [Saccharothrix sp. 6-C]
MTDIGRGLADFGTSAVSDALDVLGVSGALWGATRQSGSGTVVGPAFTVAFEPVAEGERAAAADYLDDVPPGSVVVLANGGPHCTVWGDILTEVAVARGIAGTVVDGYCRDVDGIRALGYPVWARGAFMRSGKNRVRMVAAQQPVTIGAEDDRITVRPGDLVTADGSGVVVVPAGLVAEVVATATRVAEVEAGVLAAVRAGVPLRVARADHGYNDVARRTTEATS